MAWYLNTEIVWYNLSDSQSTKSGNELLKVKIALLRRHYCIRTSDVFSRMLTSARTTNIYTYIFIQQERCQATFSYDERSKKVYPHNVIKVLVDHWIITFFSVCIEATRRRGGRWPIIVDSCFLPTKACCHVLIYTTTDKAIAAIASPFFLFFIHNIITKRMAYRNFDYKQTSKIV